MLGPFVGAICAAFLASTSGGEQPVRPADVWEVDFEDPAETGRWYVRAYGGVGSWSFRKRDAGKPDSPRILEIVATSGINVEASLLVCRDFPDSLGLSVEDSIILEWEWIIADTEVSDFVAVGIHHGIEGDLMYPVVYSHTRYTSSWTTLFVPGNEWRRERFALPGPLWADWFGPRKPPRGLCFELKDPYRQRVGVSRLRLERWLPGTLAPDSRVAPHHAPPPAEPFLPTPVIALRKATAGALDDLNGDGLPELVVIERHGHTHLYRGNSATPFIEELTDGSSLRVSTLGVGAMFVDLDADRDPDLVVTGEFDVPRVLENLGRLRFQERKLVDDSALDHWTNAAAEDLDGDGLPDLTFSSLSSGATLHLRNRGGWQFDAMPLLAQPGIFTDLVGNAFATFADLDGDRRPEMLAGTDSLFKFDGTKMQLAAAPWRDRTPIKAEGAIFEDFDGDGALDLLILRDTTESGGKTRMLLGSAGSFREWTADAALPDLVSAEVALAEDFDNDGAVDLYLCQRHRPNFVMRNDGAGRFFDTTAGSGMEDAGGCDSAVAGDIDGDGAMDVVIFRYGAAPAVLRNRLEQGRWLGVVVRGLQPATDAIGAEVRLLDAATGTPFATRWVRRGKGFGAIGPLELRFGLGERTSADVEVRFPSGRVLRRSGLPAGRTSLLVEHDGGVFGASFARTLELRYPFVRALRRMEADHHGLGWWVAAMGMLLGCATHGRGRWLALGILGAGVLMGLSVGWAPGRGLASAPLVAWVLGGTVGASIFRVPSWARRLRGASTSVVPPALEALASQALDFRHSGLETRTLLALHSRAQNLFLGGTLHEPFLDFLLEAAPRFARDTAPRLRMLALSVSRSLPELLESRTLLEEVDAAVSAIAELAGLGRDAGKLRVWRARTLPSLAALQRRLPALLEQVDRRCSCDALEVIRDVLRGQDDELREADISVALTDELRSGTRAVIPHDDLRTIIENLFANSAAAMREAPRKHIGIVVRLVDGVTVEIEFSDYGHGIPQHLEPRIFEHGVSGRESGRGYGLARSREILGHFGGSISVARARDPGATFLVRLRCLAGVTSGGT